MFSAIQMRVQHVKAVQNVFLSASHYLLRNRMTNLTLTKNALDRDWLAAAGAFRVLYHGIFGVE
jgi:hypothetical protein